MMAWLLPHSHGLRLSITDGTAGRSWSETDPGQSQPRYSEHGCCLREQMQYLGNNVLMHGLE